MNGSARLFDADVARGIARDEQAKACAFFGPACGGSQGNAAALLPILHRLQETFGHVDEAAWPVIADVLNISRAEVRGVASFYHDYRATPAGRHVLKLCRAEACQANGCEALVDDLAMRHGLAMNATGDDGALTLETVYCLGNCALGPAALYDDALVGRLDAASLDALVAEARR